MSGVNNANRIRHIRRIRQMLRQWRNKAAAAARLSRATSVGVPADVPAGHLAVYVGKSLRRFVVRVSYLNSPAFRPLLVQAEEVYGYDHAGPIAIPCDELIFVEILRLIGEGDGSTGARGSHHRPSAICATDELQRRCSDSRFWQSRSRSSTASPKDRWSSATSPEPDPLRPFLVEYEYAPATKNDENLPSFPTEFHHLRRRSSLAGGCSRKSGIRFL